MSSAIQELMSLKTDLDAEVELARQNYEQARDDAAALARAVDILKARKPESDSRPKITASEINFNGARNVRERLSRIADRSGGTVNITRGAEIIIEAGLSRSQKKDLRSTIHRTLQGDPDNWEKVKPGTFRLRRNGITP